VLVGCFCAGTGKGLAGPAAVLGEEGSDPAPDGPRAGSQIRVIGRGRLSGGQVLFHLPGPALVGHGKTLDEQCCRLERDQAEPLGGTLDVARDLQGVIELSGHRHQRRDVGADPDGQPDSASTSRFSAGLLQAFAAGIAEHFHCPEFIEDP